MARLRILYEDGRPYTVSDSLEELTGPTAGVVELPQRLDWSEQGSYDLSDPRQRNLMYERVIRGSMRAEDLRAYLHGPTLRRVWRRLWLPHKVRRLWETRPALAIGPVLLSVDAAANKLRALCGRAEVRDYIDIHGVVADGQVAELCTRLVSWGGEIEAQAGG